MYVSGLVLFWIRTVQEIPLECENKVSKLNKISKLILKSLSPIHFVKIQLSNFLGNEFLVKMYKL